jgi:hypothetical protein
MSVTKNMNVDDRIALLGSMTMLPGRRDALSALLNGATFELYDLTVGGIGDLRD